MKFLALLLSVGAALAQQYEVATVKASESTAGFAVLANPRAPTFTVRNATLLELLRLAYENSQITGPDWLDTARYDIVANAPAGASPADGPARLQALLGERLGVKAHREKAERNVYALEAPRGAEKIPTFDPNEFPNMPKVSAVTLLNGTMSDWANTLGRIVDRPVVDRTGIQGTHRFLLAYASREDSEAPSVFTALSEATGLRLTATKAEVEIVVIDSANRTPTEN